MMAKANPQPKTIYLASYAFYSEPEIKGGFAPVNSAILADVDGGNLIARLIKDFSKWTKIDYEVKLTGVLGSGGAEWYATVINCPYPDGTALECFLSFMFNNPEESNFHYSHYDLTFIFRTLVMNCAKDGTVADWQKVADKSMNVTLGYYTL